MSVPVADVGRALEFYTTTLGFEKRVDLEYGTGRHWVEVAAPGATTTLALSPPGPGQEIGIDTGIRFVTSDVEADHVELRSRGVDVDPEIMRWPNSPPMFQLRDPDGNLLRVIQREDVVRAAAGTTPRMEDKADPAAALRRFAVLVKSDARTEAGAMPTEVELAAMGRFNDELVEAGLMLAGEGFHASSDGARIRFAEGDTEVTRGPFPDPAELVAGFWVIRARSLEHAIELMRRAPMGDVAEVEIRQLFEAEEFGEAFTPELREQEERQRERIAEIVGNGV